MTAPRDNGETMSESTENPRQTLANLFPEVALAAEPRELVMSIENTPQRSPLQLLAKMQSKASDRFGLELGDLRTSMMAMAACCEESLGRLRDARWLPFDNVARLVTELTEAADAERARAASLSEELDATKRALEQFRADCRAELEAARAMALRYREETSASFAQELNAARELAVAA